MLILIINIIFTADIEICSLLMANIVMKTDMHVFVFFIPLSDSKQNGDANVTLSEEEGCSLTQPLSPSERWTLRCSRNRDKTMKEATCFLLNSGDFSCGAEPTIHTGKGELLAISPIL